MPVIYGSRGHVNNVVELRHQIKAAVATVTPDMISHVWNDT